MAIIPERSVSATSFTLPEALDQFPEATVEADRIAADAPTTTMPCLWVDEGDVSGFGAALASDPTIEAVRALRSSTGSAPISSSRSTGSAT